MNDGGPAFPRPCSEANGGNGEMWNDSEPGMSLRDYFAAAALTGFCANATWMLSLDKGGYGEVIAQKNAQAAWWAADKMMEQRGLSK